MFPWQLVACGCSEWVSRDVTNVLPTAGVGNDLKSVGGGLHEEKRKYRDDWRTSVEGKSCGWKTQHLKPSCNYILIMHMEGIIRSYHGPHTDT